MARRLTRRGVGRQSEEKVSRAAINESKLFLLDIRVNVCHCPQQGCIGVGFERLRLHFIDDICRFVPGLFPLGEAAVENRHVLVAVVPEEPPRTRGRKHSERRVVVVDNDVGVVADPQFADILAKLLRRRKRFEVRIYLEKLRGRNVFLCELRRCVAVERTHMERHIENLEVGGVCPHCLVQCRRGDEWRGSGTHGWDVATRKGSCVSLYRCRRKSDDSVQNGFGPVGRIVRLCNRRSSDHNNVYYINRTCNEY